MTASAESTSTDSPLEPSAEREERIRVRAYHLWEADGCPAGRDTEYWERAKELEAIEANPGAGLIPPESDRDVVDEAALQDNLGEFPERSADQGEHRQTPMTRSQARAGKLRR